MHNITYEVTCGVGQICRIHTSMLCAVNAPCVTYGEIRTERTQDVKFHLSSTCPFFIKMAISKIWAWPPWPPWLRPCWDVPVYLWVLNKTEIVMNTYAILGRRIPRASLKQSSKNLVGGNPPPHRIKVNSTDS